MTVGATAVEGVAAEAGEVEGQAPELDLSVVVPVHEAPAGLDEIYQAFAPAIRATGRSFEFLFVIEPGYHGMARALTPLVDAGEPIRILRLAQPFSDAVGLKVGADHARGAIVLALPAYYRVEASGIGRLVASVGSGTDIAVARRAPRRDSWVNRAQTRLLDLVIRRAARVDLADVACGVFAVDRDALRRLTLYGDLARFLPLLAMREGLRLVSVDIPQHPGDARTRVHRPGLYLRRLVDLLGLYFLLRFTERPLRFFGLIGAGLGIPGVALLILLFVQRLGGQGIANRPLLLLAVLLVVVAVQAIALGLVGEIIVHLHSPRRRPYRLAPDEGPERS